MNKAPFITDYIIVFICLKYKRNACLSSLTTLSNNYFVQSQNIHFQYFSAIKTLISPWNSLAEIHNLQCPFKPVLSNLMPSRQVCLQQQDQKSQNVNHAIEAPSICRIFYFLPTPSTSPPNLNPIWIKALRGFDEVSCSAWNLLPVDEIC